MSMDKEEEHEEERGCYGSEEGWRGMEMMGKKVFSESLLKITGKIWLKSDKDEGWMYKEEEEEEEGDEAHEEYSEIKLL